VGVDAVLGRRDHIWWAEGEVSRPPPAGSGRARFAARGLRL